MIYNFAEQNTILNRYIAELRDINIQKDRMRFRRNLERIGEIMAYEISKTLAYHTIEVKTPLGIAPTSVPISPPVIGTILRAGMPMYQGLLTIFDKADNTFIAAYRQHHQDETFEIALKYVACPDLENRVLILADPMLATGASLVGTIEKLKPYGTPSKIHIAVAIASKAGITYLQNLFPNADIWTGAIDEELNAKSYIIPGLGDAGDLAYGEKLQS